MDKFVLADGKPVYLEQVMEYVNQHHPDLHPQERYLLLDLVRRRKFGQYFASFYQLGASIGCSKNSAENLAKKLRKAGLLTWKSGSIKGNRRLANEYSLEKLLVELEKFRQEKNIKSGERCLPNIREGNPDFCDGIHPKNCTGVQDNRPENSVGPSQNLGSKNIIKNINKISPKEVGKSDEEQPKKFWDIMWLEDWAKSRPAINVIPEDCLKDFYRKMHDKDWLVNGEPIRNMEKLLLTWSRNYKPTKQQDDDGFWETPGDSFRHDDELRRRMNAKFGPCPLDD